MAAGSRGDDPFDRYDVAVHGVLPRCAFLGARSVGAAGPCVVLPARAYAGARCGAAWHHRRRAHRDLADAVAGLAGCDPVLADLIERHGPPPARRRVPVDRRFGDLARNIVYQQLAGRAAASIHGRFVDALDGDVCAERVLAAPASRCCGPAG